MKRTILIVISACAVSFLAGCGSCTTETHNVRIKETTYRPAKKKGPGLKPEPVKLPVPGEVVFGDEPVTISARPAEMGSLARLESI